jgi:acyl dehydratase
VRYFEDFHEGDAVELGPVTITEREIVEFASRFDPQPFHVDKAAAADSPFGGLIASGWHTAAVYMGMLVPALMLDAASLGSPGIESLRWTAPVRPGDTLRGRCVVRSARPSATNPRRGTVTTENELRNQDGTLVMTMTARTFFARREAA